MSRITLQFPPDFDEYAWEVQAKGWLPGVLLVFEGRRYILTIYDPARLAQDIDEVLKQGSVFAEPNLVVVRSVLRKSIESAVRELVEMGRLGNFHSDPESREGLEGPNPG